MKPLSEQSLYDIKLSGGVPLGVWDIWETSEESNEHIFSCAVLKNRIYVDSIPDYFPKLFLGKKESSFSAKAQ